MPANPFTSDVAARLYADGRPDYSQLVADIIRRITGIESPVEFAVDIGSGTGISTLAIPWCRVSGDTISSCAHAWTQSIPEHVHEADEAPVDAGGYPAQTVFLA